MIRMQCGHCNKLVRFPQEMAGQSANCPFCKALLQVALHSSALLETRVDVPVLPPGLARPDLVKFFCHFCGQRVGVPREFAGQVRPCPECGVANNVPAATDTASDYHPAVGAAKSAPAPLFGRLFPLAVLVAVGLVGLVAWRFSGALRGAAAPSERYARDDRLGIERTERLDLVVKGPGARVEHIRRGTRLEADLEVTRVLVSPSEWHLDVKRHATWDEKGPAHAEPRPVDQAGLAGKRLSMLADGTISAGWTGPEAEALVREHNSGGRPFQHLTGWLFAEQRCLADARGGPRSYRLREADAAKVLVSAFFRSVERARLSCAPSPQGPDLVLDLEFDAQATLDQQRVRLAGKGRLVYEARTRLIRSLRLDGAVSAKSFRQDGDALEGTWKVALDKTRK